MRPQLSQSEKMRRCRRRDGPSSSNRMSRSLLFLGLLALAFLAQTPAAASGVALPHSRDGLDTAQLSARAAHLFKRTRQRSTAQRRQAKADAWVANSSYLQRRQDYITAEDTTDPIAAAKAVQALPYLANNASGVTDTAHQLIQGDSDESQLPWNTAIPFIQTAATNATTAGGWEALPQVEGFTLNRTWQLVPGAVMPFYITSGVDPSQVKRAVITFPGKPRDAWKYANLYRNAMEVAYANTSLGLTNNSIIIISPVWLNELDQQGGSVEPDELYFHGSEWEAGGASRGPTLEHSLTTYGIVDNFTDMLFDKAQWPAMNQVVIAGHSMGGQASHRYAVLKKQKAYDPNMAYWVGNPGSWTYLNEERPYSNASCTSTFDAWHYGIGQNTTKIPKYARDDVLGNKTFVVQRYLERKIHMALGLLDNGAGDTHCEARDQGGNHLDRGSNYVLHLANLTGGTFPSSQTVDFIGNTSHQDYAMISANRSIYWLFANDYNTRYPDITPTDPGKQLKETQTHAPKPKAYATRGNTLLASALLGGSLVLIVAFFTALPFVFRDNFDEQAFNNETRMRSGAAAAAAANSDKKLRKPSPTDYTGSNWSTFTSQSPTKAMYGHEYGMASR